MLAHHSVLVLDANQRSALAVTRSLGRHANISIIAADETTSSLSGSSRYCSRYLQYPSATTKPHDFCDWVVEIVVRHKIDMIIPITEVTSQLLLMNKHRLGDCKVPFPDINTVMSLSNKWNLIELAKKLNVPCPQSVLSSNLSKNSKSELTSFPIVIKPCLSRIWSDEKWMHSAVHIVNSTEELDDLISRKPYLNEHPYILQEFIPGHGAGVFAIYNRGKAVAFFAHRRIREKPPSGGVSVLSESIHLDQNLQELARQILDTVNWHGVAMVEFRVDAKGQPFLMEINTRFWGSLQLSIDSGVDFPWLLYQMTMGDQIDAPPPYRTGRRLRWLLGDIDSLYLALRDKKNFSRIEKLKIFLSFFIPRPLTTRHEIDRIDDLGPAMYELAQYLQQLFR